MTFFSHRSIENCNKISTKQKKMASAARRQIIGGGAPVNRSRWRRSVAGAGLYTQTVSIIVWECYSCFMNTASLPLLCLSLFAKPYHRGFYCDDQSIRYPYKSDTVTHTMLLVVCYFMSLFVVRLYVSPPAPSSLSSLYFLHSVLPKVTEYSL